MKAATAKKTGRLNLSVQYAMQDSVVVPDRIRIRKWVRTVLLGGGEVAVRFIDEEEGRKLNADFRGKDYATNVLSFAYSPSPALAGDLALCVPVVLREASEQGKTPEAHFAHMIVHGMLHLQGYDHEDPIDAEIMEESERNILNSLGFSDPYQ